MEVSNKPKLALSIQNLVVKDSKDQILLQVPLFQLEQGLSCGVYGPSPGGAEVLFQCLINPQQKYQGDIRILGHTLEDPALGNGQVGVVSRDAAFFPDFTVIESLHFAYSLRREVKRHTSRAERSQAIDAVLEHLKLQAWRRKRTNQLPLGICQRLNLAVGLIHTPRLLIAEDPWGQADLESREIIFQVLEHFHAQGNTLIFSSPRSSEITQLATLIWLFQKRAPLAHGSLESLALYLDAPERIHLRVRSGIDRLQKKIPDLPEITHTRVENQKIILETKPGTLRLTRLSEYVQDLGLELLELSIQPPRLEEVYQSISQPKSPDPSIQLGAE